MTQKTPFAALSRRAASAARMAVFAAGLSAGWAAHAANCTDAPVSGRAYYVVNKASGLQLDVGGYAQNTGASVIQWGATSQANQQWAMAKLTNGAWTLRAVHSGQALDLWGWDTSENAPIKQFTYGGNANQQWMVAGNGDGYTIKSNWSNKLLSVADKAGGTPLKQASDQQGSALQRWYFNPVDGKCNASASPFGSFMGFNRILIGGQLDERDWSNPNDTSPDTINKAPWDIRYAYIHSPTAPKAACYTLCDSTCKSSPDGGWWGCWNMSSDGQWNTTPGLTITWGNKDNNTKYTYNGQPHRMIQEWTWYTGEDLGRMQQRVNAATGRPDVGLDYLGAVKNQTLLKSYFDDYRFMLTKVGAEKNIIHLEPDFWSYLRAAGGDNPHAVSAPVRAAAGSDCTTEEDSVSGIASCLIKMARRYASNSTVGLHFSCWDGKVDVCVSYFKELGASQGDFVATDVKDRDAEWAVRNQSWNGLSYRWTDQDFTNFLAMVKQLTETVGKPMILWQIPLGNKNMNNTNEHWQDNKVQLIFDRMQDVANAHVVALQFGSGHWQQTSTRTDGGYFLNYAKAYYAKGGVALK